MEEKMLLTLEKLADTQPGIQCKSEIEIESKARQKKTQKQEYSRGKKAAYKLQMPNTCEHRHHG